MYQYKYCPVCGKELKEDVINGHLRKHCTKCDFVHYTNPKPTVGAIAVRDKQIVLIKRGVEPGKGAWSPPSGFIDPGETAEEACLRELKEETGLDGEIRELIGVYTENARVYGPVMVIMYLVDNLQGEMKAADDALDVKFVDIDKIDGFYFKSFDEAFRKAKVILGTGPG